MDLLKNEIERKRKELEEANVLVSSISKQIIIKLKFFNFCFKLKKKEWYQKIFQKR